MTSKYGTQAAILIISPVIIGKIRVRWVRPEFKSLYQISRGFVNEHSVRIAGDQKKRKREDC